MNLSAPGAVHGALLGTIILVAAMVFIGRSSGAPRGLLLYAAVFALHILRDVLQLVEPTIGPAAALILAETAHAASGALLIAALAVGRGQPPPWRLLLGLGLVATAWLAVAQPSLGSLIAATPIYLFVGAVMVAVGSAFWLRARRMPGLGFRLVAVLFVAWGLHEWFFPLLAGDAEWPAVGFLLSQLIATALGIALVVAADRERRAGEDDVRRRAEALLKLQGEAIAAAANAIFIADRAGRVEWSNAAFTRLSGWSAAEAKGRGARRLLMRSDRDKRLDEALAAARPWRGELSLRRKDGTLYIVDQTVTPITDRGRVTHYVVVQEDVTERRQAEERIRFLSNHDALTALPNRLLFRERLQRAVSRAKAERGRLAVVFVDLDDFSHYNDVLGHDGGDRLLLMIVERLMAAARGSEVVARVGGDEFAVLVPGDGEAASEIAQGMVDAVRRPFDFDGHEVQVGASAGIALYPDDGDDSDTLMKNADIAMYRAIHEAPNGYRFFSPNMDAELAARRRMEGDLRRAITRNELVLHYQPVVAIADRRIVGLEALLRWDHAEDGLIPPTMFIPLAEANGQIAAIGEWVLREACRQARVWAEAGLPEIPVAVNLSAVQLKRQDVPMLVRKVLSEARLPAGRLELELTETTVMDDAAAALRVFTEVTAQGVSLAVDDFGTGYSSLERLKRFPVGKLKIDRSFVADLADDDSDAAIARAIISLGHALGLKVVAEGVETEAQLAILAAQGCDAVQGFLFSPAVPADEAAELLRRGGF